MNRSIDSSNIPDLLRIVEEVDATKTPRKLKRDNKIVAVISPVATHEKTTTKTEADYSANSPSTLTSSKANTCLTLP
jgi:hypothetical protein